MIMDFTINKYLYLENGEVKHISEMPLNLLEDYQKDKELIDRTYIYHRNLLSKYSDKIIMPRKTLYQVMQELKNTYIFHETVEDSNDPFYDSDRLNILHMHEDAANTGYNFHTYDIQKIGSYIPPYHLLCEYNYDYFRCINYPLSLKIQIQMGIDEYDLAVMNPTAFQYAHALKDYYEEYIYKEDDPDFPVSYYR